MRLNGKKDIQSVKSAWSVLHAELKAYALTPLQGYNKRFKTNTHSLFCVSQRQCLPSWQVHVQS